MAVLITFCDSVIRAHRLWQFEMPSYTRYAFKRGGHEMTAFMHIPPGSTRLAHVSRPLYRSLETGSYFFFFLADRIYRESRTKRSFVAFMAFFNLSIILCLGHRGLF
jgi:hypothetical protein